MNITHDGLLVKWTFTAEDQGMQNGRHLYPNLQVYRGQSLVFTLHASGAVSSTYPNVYEYVPDPPLSVEAGDYIAVWQPPKDTARLLLSFVRFAGPQSLVLNRTKRAIQQLPGREGNLPLVTLEIISEFSLLLAVKFGGDLFSDTVVLSKLMNLKKFQHLMPAIWPAIYSVCVCAYTIYRVLNATLKDCNFPN